MTDVAQFQWLEDFEGKDVPLQVATIGKGGWLERDGFAPAYEAVSGHSCLNLGHAHPELLEAAQGAFARLSYCSPEIASRESLALARKLSALLGGEFMIKYALSGASANEVALAVARSHWASQAQAGKRVCLSLERSYHGQLGQAGQLTGFEAFRDDTRAPSADIVHVASARNSEGGGVHGLETIEAKLEAEITRIGAAQIACLFVEPVGFAGGVIVPPKGYLRLLRAICDRHNILLVVDEVITGFGRSGRWFGFQHEDIRPDIVTMAKGITAGYFPLAAVAVDAKIYQGLRARNHPLKKVITMSGHPVGCAIARKAIEIVERDGLVAAVRDNAQHMGQVLCALNGLNILREIRGAGHMWGMEFTAFAGRSAAEIALQVAHRCEVLGCITAAADGIIRINPPLNMTAEERDAMLGAIVQSVEEVEANLKTAA